jgi:hypothetical protein
LGDGSDPPGLQIHGLMSQGSVPLAIERDGKLVRVVRKYPRVDLQVAGWKRRPCSYWDVDLENGERLTIYRDLVRLGWYAMPRQAPYGRRPGGWLPVT